MGSDGPPGVAERVKQWAEKKRRAAAHAYEQARDGARDVWASKDAAEAALKARLLLRRVDWNAVCAHVGRVFVALYFVNMCVENTEAYGAHRERYAVWDKAHPGHAPVPARHLPHYPWLSTLVLAPAAGLVLAEMHVLAASIVLLVDTAKDSMFMVLNQTVALVLFGMRPNELMVKKLSMMGCTALLAASVAKSERSGNALAGMLLEAEKRVEGKRKSAVLLAARIACAALFVFVGQGQLTRIWHRNELWQHKVDKLDGHDNLWLVLELVLSLPLAAGYKTDVAAVSLSATCLLEALTCWRWWLLDFGDNLMHWPLHARRMHARSHFATNVAVAGGMLLLKAAGAGRYTVDQYLANKKKT